jgi:hypothetical protein
MGCGCDLSIQVEWDREIKEANNIHWLAQCQRRLFFPIDESEQVPFVAFEYGWKVLNRLYSELSIPKLITENGKARNRNTKESLLYMFEHYGVTQPIIVKNCHLIKRLCDCVLGERGHLTFEDESEEGAVVLRTSAMEKCRVLVTAIEEKDYSGAMSGLVETLLSVRNARVHADISVPHNLPAGGESMSAVRTRGKADSMHRHDEEVHVVAEIVLAIGTTMIAAKTEQQYDVIQEYVDSRVQQIRKQIAEKVRAWSKVAAQGE